jgi:hypothetical protein
MPRQYRSMRGFSGCRPLCRCRAAGPSGSLRGRRASPSSSTGSIPAIGWRGCSFRATKLRPACGRANVESPDGAGCGFSFSQHQIVFFSIITYDRNIQGAECSWHRASQRISCRNFDPAILDARRKRHPRRQRRVDVRSRPRAAEIPIMATPGAFMRRARGIVPPNSKWPQEWIDSYDNWMTDGFNA